MSRRRKRVVLLGLVVFALVGALVGCVSTVTPPAAPEDPVTVYLVFDAKHKGVVLEEDGGEWREWGYGEWSWYALGRDEWYRVFPTVLWPTDGALGYRSLRARTGEALAAERSGARVVPIRVARADARALRDRLVEEWKAANEDPHRNPRYETTFVHAPRDYWFAWNCNDQAADWLEALGCDVSWVPVRLGLAVEEADAP